MSLRNHVITAFGQKKLHKEDAKIVPLSLPNVTIWMFLPHSSLFISRADYSSAHSNLQSSTNSKGISWYEC